MGDEKQTKETPHPEEIHDPIGVGSAADEEVE